MNLNQWFLVLVKIGLMLLIADKLGEVTYRYAVKAAYEQQFGLINLSRLSATLHSKE